MQWLASNVVEKMLSVLLNDSPSLGPSFVSLSYLFIQRVSKGLCPVVECVIVFS